MRRDGLCPSLLADARFEGNRRNWQLGTTQFGLVADEAGNPVSGALVTVAESKGRPGAVGHGAARTDAAGKTPAP